MCCIPVWVGREERGMFYLCEGKEIWCVWDKCTGVVGARSHAVTTRIAVSSTVMDFLFRLLRERHYHSS